MLPQLSRGEPESCETIVADILSSLGYALVTIDEEFRVVFFNKSAEAVFGYSHSDVVGRHLSLLIPDPDHLIHRGYLDAVLDSRMPAVMGKPRECEIRNSKGEAVPVDVSYSASSTGGRIYVTAIIRDVSGERALERQVRFMEKLADVGRAIAQVVHEIRKPLTVIGGFAKQVEKCETLKDDGKNRRKLDIIIREVQRLDKLLNGLRLISRPRSPSEYRSLVIGEVLAETVELVEPMIRGRQVKLIAEIPDEPLLILGDSDQLKQVFLNLLRNAVEAVDRVGNIRMRMGVEDRRVTVSIEDDGPGIPAEMEDKIFDPFFSTKSKGTGLGLAISHAIIQDHGGTIHVHSAQPRGTVALVTLPLEIP